MYVVCPKCDVIHHQGQRSLVVEHSLSKREVVGSIPTVGLLQRIGAEA